MASVWIERKGKPPKKLAGHLNPADAIKVWKQQCSIWMGDVCTLDGHAYHACLHHRTAKEEEKAEGPFAILYVELASPPSAPEPGQPHHPKAKKAT